MSGLKRLAALIVIAATAFAVATPVSYAAPAKDGPRVHCC
jgi:hypothetical protein